MGFFHGPTRAMRASFWGICVGVSGIPVAYVADRLNSRPLDVIAVLLLITGTVIVWVAPQISPREGGVGDKGLSLLGLCGLVLSGLGSRAADRYQVKAVHIGSIVLSMMSLAAIVLSFFFMKESDK